MKFTVNDNRDVVKGVCDRGSETCVKSVDEVSTEKSTVFISSSVGCPMKCKFCHLTINDTKYQSLSQEEIEANTIDAVGMAGYWNNDIMNRTLKLSWMGMGDAMLHPEIILDASSWIIDILEDCEDVKGLQRIDVSTVMPKSVSFNDMEYVSRLYKIMDKDGFRMFYSLFSAIPETRDYMIPNCKSAEDAMQMFREAGMTVTIHQIFIEGVNDNIDEVNAMIEFVNDNKDVIDEFRVLEYNEADNSWWFESACYGAIGEHLMYRLQVPVKFQVSPGKEIKAACGMFN